MANPQHLNSCNRLLEAMMKHDFTAHAARVMLHLSINGSTRIGALGFGFKPSGVGGTINRLVDRMLAKRVHNVGNDKVVHVELTPLGKAAARELRGY